MVMIVEFFKTIFVHLDGGHVLMLLHVNMSDVQPNLAEVSRSFSDLREYIPASIIAKSKSSLV